MRISVIGFAAVAATFHPTALLAQAAFEAAKGEITVISSRPLALTADFSQSGIALDLMREYDVGEDDLAEHRFSNQIVVTGHLGVAANKGKRSLFSGGNFTPGYDVDVAAAYVIERASECFDRLPDGSCRRSRRGGYYGPVLQISHESTSRSIADNAGATVALDDVEERTNEIAVGWRWAPSERHVFALAGGRRWTTNSTELLDERQVCVTESTGAEADGTPVVVADCKSRHVGTVSDMEAWNARLDYLAALRVSADKPGFGLVGSYSWTQLDHRPASNSVAFGPVLLAENTARQAYGGLFVVFEDFGSLSELLKDAADLFSFRLYVSVDLPAM